MELGSNESLALGMLLIGGSSACICGFFAWFVCANSEYRCRRREPRQVIVTTVPTAPVLEFHSPFAKV